MPGTTEPVPSSLMESVNVTVASVGSCHHGKYTGPGTHDGGGSALVAIPRKSTSAGAAANFRSHAHSLKLKPLPAKFGIAKNNRFHLITCVGNSTRLSQLHKPPSTPTPAPP